MLVLNFLKSDIKYTHRKYRRTSMNNYDSKHVVESHEIFHSTRRQIGVETRRLREKRKSYVVFCSRLQTRRRQAHIGYSSRLDGVK